MRSDAALPAALQAALPATLAGALAAAGAACTGSPPEPPPLEMPPAEVFADLFKRAPAATVVPPLTLDTRSCAFARYTAESATPPQPFVMMHPLRSRCELWLGRIGFVFQYCLFPREELVEIDSSLRPLFRVEDDEHCTFGADPPG